MAAAIGVLLVSDSHRWELACTRGSRESLGGMLIIRLCPRAHALSLWSGRQDEDSHLLIEPACAGELMGDFVGRTSR